MLTTLGAAGAASLAGCLGSLTGGGGTSRADEVAQTVKDKFSKYDGNPSGAIKAGYRPLGPAVKNMGWHFFNQKLVGDAVKNGFSAEKPQILIYDTDGKTLVGVEWGGPASKMSRSPEFLSDVDEATYEIHKSATHVFATEDGSVQKMKDVPPKQVLNTNNWTEFRPPDPDMSSGDTVSDIDFTGDGQPDERVVDMTANHPSLVSIHLWAFSDNPNGRFATTNPNVANDGEEVEF